jgi:hypothetical protein
MAGVASGAVGRGGGGVIRGGASSAAGKRNKRRSVESSWSCSGGGDWGDYDYGSS